MLQEPLPDETLHIEEPARPAPGKACLQPKKKKCTDPTGQLVGLATDYFKKPETEEDVLAKSWAYKLKRLSGDQKRFAEKIINDALFEAEMGNLTEGGVRPQTPQHWSTSPTLSNLSSEKVRSQTTLYGSPSSTSSPSSQSSDVVRNLPYHDEKGIKVSIPTLPELSHDATNKEQSQGFAVINAGSFFLLVKPV